jgi:hypothetical protein
LDVAEKTDNFSVKNIYDCELMRVEGKKIIIIFDIIFSAQDNLQSLTYL